MYDRYFVIAVIANFGYVLFRVLFLIYLVGGFQHYDVFRMFIDPHIDNDGAVV